MACHQILRESAKVGDGSDGLFWIDPWSPDGQKVAAKLHPFLHDYRLHAERALTLIANARAAYPAPNLQPMEGLSPLGGAVVSSISIATDQGAPHLDSETWVPLPSNPTTLHHPEAIDALELGARRLDFIGLKFQLADEIVDGYTRALSDLASTDKKTHQQTSKELSDIRGANGRLEDIRDTYALLRDLYAQSWLRTNRPYALRPVLSHYDDTISLWNARIDRFRAVQRQLDNTKTLPTPFELGLPTK
jgi:hypothetical protein